MDAIHVVLADDHPIVGAGLHILEELRHLFEDLAPDILLIDMRLDHELVPPAPPAKPPPAAPQVFVLRGQHRHAYVFGLLTGESAAELSEQQALRAIADSLAAGLVGDGGAHVSRVTTKLLAPQPESGLVALPDLTARELDVLRQLATGKSDRGIAEQLGISDSTVHYHLRNIYRKLRVRRRSELIAWAARSGWAD